MFHSSGQIGAGLRGIPGADQGPSVHEDTAVEDKMLIPKEEKVCLGARVCDLQGVRDASEEHLPARFEFLPGMRGRRFPEHPELFLQPGPLPLQKGGNVAFRGTAWDLYHDGSRIRDFEGQGLFAFTASDDLIFYVHDSLTAPLWG